MAIQIQYTDKISAKDGVKAVLYGEFGVGKTPLLATAPRPIIFSAEEGLLSLRKLRVAYIDVSNYKDLVEAVKWLNTSSEARNFDTPCLDSMSEIAEVIFAEERRKNNDPRKYVPAARDQMYELVRHFRDMKGKNVVFVGKQAWQDNGIGQKRAVPAMDNDKLQQAVPYFFDLVLHLYIGTYYDANNQQQQFRGIHTKQGYPEYQARDRSGNLDLIEWPDLSAIFKKATS